MLERKVRQHLRDQEHLLWFGRPSKPPAKSRQYLFETVLVVLVILGLVTACSLLSGHPVAQVIIIAVGAFVVFALLLTMLSTLKRNRKLLSQTAYAITQERAMVLIGTQVFSQDLGPATRFQYTGSTPENILIWDDTDQARAEVPPMRFQQLADGEAVAVLQGLLGGARALKT